MWDRAHTWTTQWIAEHPRVTYQQSADAAYLLARHGDTASEIYVRTCAALDAFACAGLDTDLHGVDETFDFSFGEIRPCDFNAAIARAGALADQTPDPQLAALIALAAVARNPLVIRQANLRALRPDGSALAGPWGGVLAIPAELRRFLATHHQQRQPIANDEPASLFSGNSHGRLSQPAIRRALEALDAPASLWEDPRDTPIGQGASADGRGTCGWNAAISGTTGRRGTRIFVPADLRELCHFTCGRQPSTSVTARRSTAWACGCSAIAAWPRRWSRRPSCGCGAAPGASTPRRVRCAPSPTRSPAASRSTCCGGRPHGRAALTALSPKHREILELHFDPDLTYLLGTLEPEERARRARARRRSRCPRSRGRARGDRRAAQAGGARLRAAGGAAAAHLRGARASGRGRGGRRAARGPAGGAGARTRATQPATVGAESAPPAARHAAAARRRARRRARAGAGGSGRGRRKLVGDDGPSGPYELQAALTAPGSGAELASADVREIGQGRVVTLRSSELPVLAEGEYYALWFVGPEDSPSNPDRISAGTFHPDAQGRTDVTFHAAVDPDKYPVVAVTEEPGDGDPGPTRPDVLRSRAAD